VRHPNKSVWLVHQHRAAYDLAGTPYCLDFEWTDADVGARQRLFDLDRRMIGEAKRVYTIGGVPTARLEKYNGLHAEALYHPPQLAGRLRHGPYGDYVLSVGRIESVKRVDLLVNAMASIDRPVKLVIAGDGTQRANVERVAEERGVTDRVTFLGSVVDDQLVDLYAGALAVAYPPFDEDFGYVTLEGFLARKPVITCTDSGGPNEFVRNGVNGFVCAPDPAEIAAAVNRLAADRRLAAELGDAGHEVAAAITWDGVIERLIACHNSGDSAPARP
jgi:glycosyltransferase involved in cell wall biosynthesis